MRLFGTVIAVLFHPGSSSKINGKNIETITLIFYFDSGTSVRYVLLPSETSTCMFTSRAFEANEAHERGCAFARKAFFEFMSLTPEPP